MSAKTETTRQALLYREHSNRVCACLLNEQKHMPRRRHGNGLSTSYQIKTSTRRMLDTNEIEQCSYQTVARICDRGATHGASHAEVGAPERRASARTAGRTAPPPPPACPAPPQSTCAPHSWLADLHATRHQHASICATWTCSQVCADTRTGELRLPRDSGPLCLHELKQAVQSYS